MSIIKKGCICGDDYYTSTEQCDNINCNSERKNKYYCNECNKPFNSLEDLNDNEREEQKKEGTFVCSDCINKEMDNKTILLIKYKDQSLRDKEYFEGFVYSEDGFKLWLKEHNERRTQEGSLKEYAHEFDLIKVGCLEE